MNFQQILSGSLEWGLNVGWKKTHNYVKLSHHNSKAEPAFPCVLMFILNTKSLNLNQKLYLWLRAKLTKAETGKQNYDRCHVGNKAIKTKLTNMLRGKGRKKRKKDWICKVK